MGEYIDVYEDGGTMMIKDPDIIRKQSDPDQQQTGSIQIEREQPTKAGGAAAEEEPDFMKYIKGCNMNFDDKAYLQQHFEEEESGLAEQQIQTGQTSAAAV